MKKEIATGTSDFKKLIESNSYYVDKSKIIEDLLRSTKDVYLFPRPRRFGKSLFISMMDNFLNIEYVGINDNLFKGLYIENSKYYKFLSTIPVINLDFKCLKSSNYEHMYGMFKEMIRKLYSSKRYLLEILEVDEKEIFNSFLYETATLDKYKESINILCNYMNKYYNKKVVILIDEYDVPIQEGYLHGYYNEIIELIKGVFSSCLKGNINLDFAVMTGVLRVSKESLFSDLNNLDIYSILDNKYNDYFGFTIDETKELLEYYDLELSDSVKNMYDGYNFGKIEIFNPWSIMKYADRKVLDSYWVNTSGNELIINCIKECNDDIKITFEKLLSGDSVDFIYNDKITYLDFEELKSLDNILNLLFVSGYLTIDKEYIDDFGNKTLTVKLPNEEVKSFFKRVLTEVFVENYHIENRLLKDFCYSVLKNDKESMERNLNRILPNMSYMDSSESFYHGYLLGLFSQFLNANFIVKSNRESGCDRFDLMIKKRDNSIGFILELKITKDDIETSALKVLSQIEDKEYYYDLVNDKVENIYKYAIVFKGKTCIVR